MNPKVKRMLLKSATALVGADLPHAFGGAIAMAAWGYSRETQDVDVFVNQSDTHEVLRVLREAGFQIVPVMEPFHYAGYLGRVKDPEERIDILFPADDPDWSAVQAPESKPLAGRSIEVFPLVLLIASKFYANRPKDELDIAHMLSRGLFDPKKVEAILRRMGDLDGADEFRALITQLSAERPQRKRPPRRTT